MQIFLKWIYLTYNIYIYVIYILYINSMFMFKTNLTERYKVSMSTSLSLSASELENLLNVCWDWATYRAMQGPMTKQRTATQLLRRQRLWHHQNEPEWTSELNWNLGNERLGGFVFTNINEVTCQLLEVGRFNHKPAPGLHNLALLDLGPCQKWQPQAIQITSFEECCDSRFLFRTFWRLKNPPRHRSLFGFADGDPFQTIWWSIEPWKTVAKRLRHCRSLR